MECLLWLPRSKERFNFVIHLNFRVLSYRSIAIQGIASVFFLVLLAGPGLLKAQGAKVPPNPAGYWLGYFGDNKINSRIGIHSEAQFRNFFLDPSVSTLLLRVGLNVYLKPYAMVTAGYGYIYSDPSGDRVAGSRVSENRIWQQLILRQKSTYIFMEHRYRLEQRLLHNLTSDVRQTDHRLRYRFQTLFPLYSISPHLRHLFLALNSELMINFKSDPSRLFDRNRFFSGIGYQVSPKMNFQLGYLNQYSQIPGNPRPQIDHILQFAVSYNMDDLMQSFFTSKKREP